MILRGGRRGFDPDALKVLSFRRWRYEIRLNPFFLNSDLGAMLLVLMAQAKITYKTNAPGLGHVGFDWSTDSFKYHCVRGAT